MAGGKAKGVGSEPGVKVIAENRRARFDYTVDEKVEAGLELTGSEVKALREGTANLADAYALPKGSEVWLAAGGQWHAVDPQHLNRALVRR